MLETVKKNIGEIWEELNVCQFTRTNKDKYCLKIENEYRPPFLDFKTLVKLSKIFGTEEIDVDHYSEKGCDTCDYGSKYGHEISIFNPTLLLSEIQTMKINAVYDIKQN